MSRLRGWPAAGRSARPAARAWSAGWAYRGTVFWSVAGGVLLAVVWRGLVPLTVHAGDSDETSAGVDLTLGILGLLAGLATAAWAVHRLLAAGPGPGPLGAGPSGLGPGPLGAGPSGLGPHAVSRCVAAIAGSLVAGLVAWPVGDLIGRPQLTAHGVVLAWPVGTCLGLFVAAMTPRIGGRLNG